MNIPPSSSLVMKVVAFSIALLFSISSSFAVAWTNPDNGDWSDSTKWTGGVPGSTATADFNKEGTYTVSLTGATTAGVIQLNGALASDATQNVTVDVKGFVLTLGNSISLNAATASTTGNHHLTLTNTAGSAADQSFNNINISTLNTGTFPTPASITFHNLGKVSTGIITVGNTSTSGSLKFAVSGTTTLTTSALPVIGGGAGNSIEVSGGASFTTTAGGTAFFRSLGTNLSISGTNSSYSMVNMAARVGSNTDGSAIAVSSGGKLSAGGMTVGHTESGGNASNNTITVSGTNSEYSGTALTIGSASAPSPTGNKVTVSSGGLVSLSSAGTALTINNGGIFDLATGGTLQATGTIANTSADRFLFNGGTLKFINTNTKTFDATMVTGTTSFIDTNSNDATLGGVLSSGGGINKIGDGTLTLSNAANTYSGGTTVTGGTLVSSASGSLGSGDVEVLGTAINLTITTGTAISDTAILSLAGGGGSGADFGYAQLNGLGVETVGALFLGGNLATLGTWGSTDSLAVNQNDEYFSGTGIINNLAIPEPSTFVMLLGGFGVLLGFQRRRKLSA